jgi:hypothetical protein
MRARSSRSTIEAFRRLDVLEIDGAEGGLERGDDFDQLVRVALLDFDVEHVDAGEFLEQHRLAFHHRLGGERADGPKTQHRGAVGDDADQIAARGKAKDIQRVFDDGLAGGGNARRIGQRQVALVDQLLGRGDGDLSREFVIVGNSVSLGARPDVKSEPGACASGFGRPDKFARADLTFYTLAPGSADAAQKPVEAIWRPVTLAAHSPRELGVGDCELIEQFRNNVLPMFNTRNAVNHTTCIPHQESGSVIDLKFDSFAAAPPRRAAAVPANSGG